MKGKSFLAIFMMCALMAFGAASHVAAAAADNSAGYHSKAKAKMTSHSRKESKIKKAAMNAEKGTKETGKEISKGGQKAGEAVARGSEEGAKEMARATKRASHTTAKGARKGGRAMARGIKKVGSGIKKAGK